MKDENLGTSYEEMMKMLQQQRWDITLAHRQSKCEDDCPLCKADANWLRYQHKTLSTALKRAIDEDPPASHLRAAHRAKLKKLRKQVKGLAAQASLKSHRIALMRLRKCERLDTLGSGDDDGTPTR